MEDNGVLGNRLEQLRADLQRGQRMLAELDQQRAEMQRQLLRIEGAIQVLLELTAGQEPEPELETVGDGQLD